jgi:hypothetical protein
MATDSDYQVCHPYPIPISLGLPQLADPFYGSTAIRQYGTALRQ